MRPAWLSLLGTLVLFVVGCAAPGVPVATVAVGLSRATVPQGGPLEASFRFTTSPQLEAIEDDYQVLVHFLDDENVMMWSDDHAPPVPTSTWRPDQTISYTRRVMVPMYPYIGEAVVAVGLYSPETGERLTLAGEDLGERAYQGALLTLTPQADSSHLYYGDGWHQTEISPDARERWRWTSDRVSLSFRNPNSDALLYLNLVGRPSLFEEGEQRVDVRVGENVVHQILIASAEPQFEVVELQADQLGEQETVQLDLHVAPTFIPAELPGGTSDDVRRLGVRVLYAFIEPR